MKIKKVHIEIFIFDLSKMFKIMKIHLKHLDTKKVEYTGPRKWQNYRPTNGTKKTKQQNTDKLTHTHSQ